jgi:hypothetical protein
MAALSDYAENLILDFVLNAGTLTPTTLYVAMATSAITDADTGTTLAAKEPSYSAYARKSTAAGDWNTASARATTNANDITFVLADGDADVTHIAIVDNGGSSGNILFHMALTATLEIANGVTTPEFKAGDIALTWDNDSGSGGIGTFLANEVLDHIFGKGTFSPAGTQYLDLCETAIADWDQTWVRNSGGLLDICDYTSYLPLAVTSATWDAAASGVVDNTAAVSFAKCTGGTNTGKTFAIWDANSGAANLYFFGDLGADISISNNVTPKFPLGELDFVAA